MSFIIACLNSKVWFSFCWYFKYNIFFVKEIYLHHAYYLRHRLILLAVYTIDIITILIKVLFIIILSLQYLQFHIFLIVKLNEANYNKNLNITIYPCSFNVSTKHYFLITYRCLLLWIKVSYSLYISL